MCSFDMIAKLLSVALEVSLSIYLRSLQRILKNTLGPTKVTSKNTKHYIAKTYGTILKLLSKILMKYKQMKSNPNYWGLIYFHSV